MPTVLPGADLDLVRGRVLPHLLGGIEIILTCGHDGRLSDDGLD